VSGVFRFLRVPTFYVFDFSSGEQVRERDLQDDLNIPLVLGVDVARFGAMIIGYPCAS